MVVFTCNNCGESLQKPKVAKHYQFQCRSSENLTCVDCHKDFYGQEYVAHTSCITESERYGGQDYVARPGQNKGEKKQKEWINIVKNVFDTATNLSHDERNVLNILSKHDNIPRKKAKFLNFIRNIMGHRVNMAVIDSVWNRMETAFKGTTQQNSVNQTQNSNGKENGTPVANGSSPTKNHENNIAENQNNENIVRENGNTDENDETREKGVGEKKKSKKRDLTVPETEQKEEPVSKKKKKKLAEENAENVTTVEQEENQEIAKFDWKATILEIVGSKDEITVKKLQKKVVNRYLSHCGNTVSLEKATVRFYKKLQKTSQVVLDDDKVRLVQINQ